MTNIKKRLRNDWGVAVLAEGIAAAAKIVLWLIEAAVFVDSPLWMLPVMTAADWLIVSPCLLGRDALYARLCDGEAVPAACLARYWRRQEYRRALIWRLGIWARRLMIYCLCWTPGIILWILGRVTRLTAERQGVIVFLPFLYFAAGAVALAVGAMAAETEMLRYRPTAWLIARGVPPWRAFGESRRLTRGRLEELLTFYRRRSGWLIGGIPTLPGLYFRPLLHTGEAALFAKWSAALAKSDRL